jgi:hypothetical protein
VFGDSADARALERVPLQYLLLPSVAGSWNPRLKVCIYFLFSGEAASVWLEKLTWMIVRTSDATTRLNAKSILIGLNFKLVLNQAGFITSQEYIPLFCSSSLN